MPVALVTGTSSGMGLHTAVQLAAGGHHVVATVRDLARADRLLAAAEAAGTSVDVRVLEVTDHVAGTALVDAVVAEHGALDVLVNNAGRGAVATAEQLSIEQVREQLETNFVSVVALTKAALPHMRAAGRGRIVTVTSVGGAVGQPFADAYCAAKFAVEGFMQSLAPVAERFGVQVAIVEPAAVASDFVANVDREAAAADADDPYAELLAAYVARTTAAFAAAQSPEDAAAVIVQAATGEEHRLRWQTSESAEQFVGVSLADLTGERVLGFTRTWLG
ncbi:MAG: SDR family NAD(P)-dependent oxidoreductase [Candidatus Nanopelagicales bacterium]